MNNSMPSIFDGLVVVSLSIGQWTGRIQDKVLSRGVNTDNEAAADQAVVYKALGDMTPLRKIQKVVSRARNYIQQGIYWAEGQFMFPAVSIDKTLSDIQAFRREFLTLVEDFASSDQYKKWVLEAPARMGKMFNPKDYPADIRGRFRFEVDVLPVPRTGGHLLVRASEETRLELEKAMNRTITDRVSEAVSSVKDRLGSEVRNASRLLSPKGKLFDTLFPRLVLIGELAEAAGWTEGRRVLDVISGESVEAVRKDVLKRTEIKMRLDDIFPPLPSDETIVLSDDELDKLVAELESQCPPMVAKSNPAPETSLPPFPPEGTASVPDALIDKAVEEIFATPEVIASISPVPEPASPKKTDEEIAQEEADKILKGEW